jgi:diguanylate cyclase (GGDEF)-like protein
MNRQEDVLQAEIAQLKERIVELEQEKSDLDIALATAVEHGDAIDADLSAINERLVQEVAERLRAESRLERLLDVLKQKNTDLELLVSTIAEHSDGIDEDWLKRYREAEQLSRIDELTGILNRRGFNETLDRYWRSGLRDHQPLGVVMLDVDLFKQFNDLLGHPAGDRCLTQLGKILQQSCRRPGDVPARYGGEEFVVLLPHTDMAGALHMVEQFRQLLADAAIEHPGSPSGFLTVSCGVAAEVPKRERDPAIMIAEVDQQLYQAKREGRNTVRSAAV